MTGDANTQLCTIARQLLSEGKVDLVLGFERGSLPWRSRPLFALRPEAASRLIVDAFCESNLARYLPGLRGRRVAIVARGCEGRAIATLVAEDQVERQEVVILGVPCQGLADRSLLEAAAPGEILAAEDEGPEIAIRGQGWARRLPRAEVLCRACQACSEPNADPADVFIGEPAPARERARDLAAEFGAQPAEERWAAFVAETSRCIRCYACREACPMCYCPECFVDRNEPRWFESGVLPIGQQMWHIMRAYHQAGRCARCGACERACPLGLQLVHLTDKLNQVAEATGAAGRTREEQR